MGTTQPNEWPSLKDTTRLLFVAALITIVEIHFSQQLGLLAGPSPYDGIGYVLLAKSAYYRLQATGLSPGGLFDALFGGGAALLPLWVALMVGDFWILGEGEWQAYAVRFWPTLLLLLLVFWVIRRRGSGTVAWVAVLFTGLLPTISVTLRATGWEYFVGSKFPDLGFYLADLRPDLLFAVLLLWTVVPLIERVRNLDRRTWLVSGSCGALAILAKSSTTPLLLAASGVAVVYVLIVNRRQLVACLSTALWGLVPFVTLLVPWILAGGVGSTVEYLTRHLTTGRTLYTNPNSTFLEEAGHYWEIFPYHMGHWESWLFLGLGLILWLAGRWTKRARWDDRLVAYLALAAVLYTIISATPNKNAFVGLPFQLLLWLFSWAVLGEFLGALLYRDRLRRVLLVVLSCLYAAAVAGAGLYALQHWPAGARRTLQENKATTERIAADLRAILTNEDCFMWIPAFGYPAALQYLMVDAQGYSPEAIWIDPPTAPPPAEFLEKKLGSCAAILVYTENIEEAAKHFNIYQLGFPYWTAVADSVRQPNSPYRLVRTYRLRGRYPDRIFAVQLYIKEPELAVRANDSGWPGRVEFRHGARAGEAYSVPEAGPGLLFRTDFDTSDGLDVNRYGRGGGLTFIPVDGPEGGSVGRYESHDRRDHIASRYVSPPAGERGLLFFSAWVRPQGGQTAPALRLQDENYVILSRARKGLKRPDGWILLVGVAEKTGAGRVRLVVMEPPGTVSLIDKMLLVEASRE